MKLRWMIRMGIVTTVAALVAPAGAGTRTINDESGKTMALVVVCDSCQSSDGANKQCHSGVERGWLNGAPCGKCLVDENAGQKLAYPYDLHLTGKLVDGDGSPLKQRFVKLYLANGWTVRTRTADDGIYRLMLGATQDRKAKKPLVVDLGTQVDTSNAKVDYALYLMPDAYKPCPPGAAKSETPKPSAAAGRRKATKK